jgi:arginyl-tRNA synthetase
VRANSVFKKIAFDPDAISQPSTVTDIEKYIDRFEEVVAKCITLWEPHHMVDYLLDLAQAFNTWYVKVKIIDESNKDMAYNLAIVKNFHTTMKKGLHLLGIEAPEKM